MERTGLIRKIFRKGLHISSKAGCYLIYPFYLILIRAKCIQPKVIVFMDGGICSQMHQYLIGRIFGQKGFKVEYDLTFYKICGKDILGQFERNFDITKAFPHLELKEASPFSIRLYKNLFYHYGDYQNDGPEKLAYLSHTPPVYLGGWYRDPDYLWKEMFHQYYHIDPDLLDEPNRKLLDEIKKKTVSVAVHVRRGDLKSYNQAYGEPASISYFSDAIRYFKQKYEQPYYFFFSDEPLWVKNELVPQLSLDGNFRIVDVNDSQKGYFDLSLMAACSYQIGSKGSLGKFAFLLNENPGKEIVLCNDSIEAVWGDRLNPVVFI